jgi:bifunctional enzyme CysN/CysC
LPEGKLEQIKEFCKNNSRPFEYAFLLDALKDEQSQGITIDVARCFFKSDKRDYLILDAPGHIEFLKNMISGTAKAEAALLVIDAKEGVKENSKRHGYMLSLLGIKEVIVCINKMDLINYDKKRFEQLKKEYSDFLYEIGITPRAFIPTSAVKGDNIYKPSEKMEWFKGHTVLSGFDSFEKQEAKKEKPFRMPVQDIYKFTKKGDNRRIVAGKIQSGSIREGDEVIFLPSGKKSKIKSIENFNSKRKKEVSYGYSVGFTLDEQIYLTRGEIMCKINEKKPYVSSLIKANIFWLGKNPLTKQKEYYLKLGTTKVPIKIKEIQGVLNASNLKKIHKQQVERNEVASCLISCYFPLAFDVINNIKETARLVIVDNYDVSGGGIITEYIEDNYTEARKEVFSREEKWDSSFINYEQRATRYSQIPKLILITGKTGTDKKIIARKLEKDLFESGKKIYFLGIRNILRGLGADIEKQKRKEHIRRLAEVSHILLDAGLLVVVTASDLISEELKFTKEIIGKDNIIIVEVNGAKSNNLADLNLPISDTDSNVFKIKELLKSRNIIFSL